MESHHERTRSKFSLVSLLAAVVIEGILGGIGYLIDDWRGAAIGAAIGGLLITWRASRVGFDEGSGQNPRRR